MAFSHKQRAPANAIIPASAVLAASDRKVKDKSSELKSSALCYHLIFPVDVTKQTLTAQNLIRLSEIRKTFMKCQIPDQVFEYLVLLTGLIKSLEAPEIKSKMTLHQPLMFINGTLTSTHPVFELGFWLVTLGDKCFDLMIFQLLNVFKDQFNQTKDWKGIDLVGDDFVKEMGMDRVLRYSRRFCILAVYYISQFTVIWNDVHKSTTKMENNLTQTTINIKLKIESIQHQLSIVSALTQAVWVIKHYKPPPDITPDTEISSLAECIMLLSRSKDYWSRIPSESERYQLAGIIELLSTVLYVMIYDRWMHEGETALAHWCITQIPAGWFDTIRSESELAMKRIGALSHVLPMGAKRPVELTKRWFAKEKEEKQSYYYSTLTLEDVNRDLIVFPDFHLYVHSSAASSQTTATAAGAAAKK